MEQRYLKENSIQLEHARRNTKKLIDKGIENLMLETNKKILLQIKLKKAQQANQSKNFSN